MATVHNLQADRPTSPFWNANEMLIELERRRKILQQQIDDTDDDEDAAALFADYWVLRVAAEAMTKAMKRKPLPL